MGREWDIRPYLTSSHTVFAPWPGGKSGSGAEGVKRPLRPAIFNAARLTQLLEAAGFGDVRPWKHEDAPELMIDDCSRTLLDSRSGPIALSLNLLGVKKHAAPAETK